MYIKKLKYRIKTENYSISWHVDVILSCNNLDMITLPKIPKRLTERSTGICRGITSRSDAPTCCRCVTNSNGLIYDTLFPNTLGHLFQSSCNLLMLWILKRMNLGTRIVSRSANRGFEIYGISCPHKVMLGLGQRRSKLAMFWPTKKHD